MKLSTSRESLLKPLQAVIGVVERRQTMPVLANVLLVATDGQLTVTATDLEVELSSTSGVDQVKTPGEITVPGRKLLDICRALEDGSNVTLSLSGDRVTVQSGRSKFVLSTLPAAEFPLIDDAAMDRQFVMSQADLSQADLLGTNLERAKITTEQLSAVESLIGATMPNGTKGH